MAQWQVKAGKGKYCSKPCMYKFRQRPSGLTYEIKAENVGWFKPGHHPSPDTEFRKGIQNNPNGGIKPGQRLSPATEFQVGALPHNFKGDQVGYHALHKWVAKHKNDPGKCEHCGVREKLEWANKSQDYQRDLDDWLRLCQSCHRQYDQHECSDTYGRASVLYPEIRRHGQ